MYNVVKVIYRNLNSFLSKIIIEKSTYIIIFDNDCFDLVDGHLFGFGRGHEHVPVVVHLVSHRQDLFFHNPLFTLQLMSLAGKQISLLLKSKLRIKSVLQTSSRIKKLKNSISLTFVVTQNKNTYQFILPWFKTKTELHNYVVQLT